MMTVDEKLKSVATSVLPAGEPTSSSSGKKLASTATSSSSRPPRISPAHVSSGLTSLSRDMAALKKRGDAQITDIQEIAERTWRINLAYERRVQQLENEKKQLDRMIETIWNQFDQVILPLWRFDDDLVPIYEELGKIRSSLESLSRTRMNPTELSQSLVQLQERLHELENNHVVDGKFVPKGWKNTMKVPSGQAMCSNLMNRCYRMVHRLVENESIVHPALQTIENTLEDIISNLSSLRDSFAAGFDIDPAELYIFQQQVDEIDSSKKDGKFIAPDGSIPEGQAAIQELLEWAYDLIHECIVLQEAQEGEHPEVSSLSEKLSDVRSSLFSYAKTGTGPSVSRPVFSTLVNTVKESASYVTDTVMHPIRTLGRLRSLVSSSFGFASRLASDLEPVPEEFQDTEAELIVIRKTLKGMRNQRNQVYLEGKVEGREGLLSRYNKVYIEQLGDIQAILKKLDETVKKSRSDRLMYLQEECYSLVMEMIDETCL